MHEPGALVALCLEVLQRCLLLLVSGVGIGASLQEDETELVVVVDNCLPDRGESSPRLQVGVGSIGQQPRYQHGAALFGGYQERGEAVVQGVGIGSLFQKLGGGGLDTLALVLVTAFVLADEETQRRFILVLGGIGGSTDVERELHAFGVCLSGCCQQFLIAILQAVAGNEQQAEQRGDVGAAYHAPNVSRVARA